MHRDEVLGEGDADRHDEADEEQQDSGLLPWLSAEPEDWEAPSGVWNLQMTATARIAYVDPAAPEPLGMKGFDEFFVMFD